MIAEFNWWLLIVGLVVGAGLAWLVLTEMRRRDEEIAEAELAEESDWIATMAGGEGSPVSVETAERVLRLHRLYLGLLPPDDPVETSEPES
jgi:hypothetical protein